MVYIYKRVLTAGKVSGLELHVQHEQVSWAGYGEKQVAERSIQNSYKGFKQEDIRRNAIFCLGTQIYTVKYKYMGTMDTKF